MTYCGPTFKPKLPTQQPPGSGGVLGGSKGATPNDSFGAPSITITNIPNTQKQRLAQKLREITILALSISTGKKLNLQKLNQPRPSYVIPGFGYALMDIFENGNVDMENIAKKPTFDDVKSPFISPSRVEKRSKTKMSPSRFGDSPRRKKKIKKKGDKVGRNKSEALNMSKAPPIQYKLLKIKTSVGNYPILNMNPPFTNEEIRMTKKCLINGWQKPPSEDDDKPAFTKTTGHKEFKIEMSPVKEAYEKPPTNEGEGEAKEQQVILEPRTRAAGGIWMQAADFPFCFQYFIVFHNEEKIPNRMMHKDIWTNPKKTYKSNEKDIYIRLRDLTKEEHDEFEAKQSEEQKSMEKNKYVNLERQMTKIPYKKLLMGFSPNPTLRAADKLPRYYCRVNEIKTQKMIDKEDANKSNHIMFSSLEKNDLSDEFLFSHYFSGQILKFEAKPKIIIKPKIYAPMGFNIWCASEHKIEILTHSQF